MALIGVLCQNEPPSEPGEQENKPEFEIVYQHADVILGPILNFSLEEALAQAKIIAQKKGIKNPRSKVAILDEHGNEFILSPDEAQAEWSMLVADYQDETEAIPLVFIDGE